MLAQEIVMKTVLGLLISLSLFAGASVHARSPSEASIDVSADMSAAAGEALGASIGAGAGLVLGPVKVMKDFAELTIVVGVLAGSESYETMMRVPRELGERIQGKRGERIEAEATPHGTRLKVDEDVIAFIPAEAKLDQPRRAL
jgi:hypothetical protein